MFLVPHTALSGRFSSLVKYGAGFFEFTYFAVGRNGTKPENEGIFVTYVTRHMRTRSQYDQHKCAK